MTAADFRHLSTAELDLLIEQLEQLSADRRNEPAGFERYPVVSSRDLADLAGETLFTATLSDESHAEASA